jgi:hypothetical protein
MPHHFREDQPVRDGALGLVAGMMISPAAFSATSAASETLKEASSTFEAALIAPFMHRVSTVIESGLGPGESESIVALIARLKPGDEGNREFTVRYAGRETTLHVHVVVGPGESAKIAFLTSPEPADRIRKERNFLPDDLDK